MSAHITQSFDAVPESVGALRRAAVAFAAGHGAPESLQGDIALAVSEAASNVVLHAYRADETQGAVHLEAKAGPRSIRISIRDDGCGMQPRPDSPGVGLGLPLIARLTDGLEVASDGGTHIAMCFAVEGATARPL